jgi:rhodanese-related sulfurtransferase
VIDQRVPEIDVAELARRLAEGAPLLDVRRPDEYADVHVPGAVLIPLDELADRVAELPAPEPLQVICRTGGRSLAAAEWLRSRDVDAVNVAGGTLAWIESGRPVATGRQGP